MIIDDYLLNIYIYLWVFYGLSMGFLWAFHGFSWVFYGFLWGIRGNPWVFYVNLLEGNELG